MLLLCYAVELPSNEFGGWYEKPVKTGSGIPHNLRPILASQGAVFLQFRANLAGRTRISDKSGVQIRFLARKQAIPLPARHYFDD